MADLFITNNKAADIRAQWLQLHSDSTLKAVDTVDRQLKGLGQVESLVPRHQLETFAHLEIGYIRVNSVYVRARENAR